MNKQERIAQAIQQIITTMMDRVMDNVLSKDPFIPEEHHAKKPLYAALVPDEIFKGSHFERRFVTPFGGVWERLTQAVAQEQHGHCDVSHTINGTIGTESLRRIQEVLNRLEHAKKGAARTPPNWQQELAYIKAGGGELIPVSVLCDIFIHNSATNVKYAFELKGPLPNSDQTKVSKEKLFKLLAMNPPQINHAYYALPYNPYGEKSAYAWAFPIRWFNMQQDESVLIGQEYWDLIGGTGTYQNFINEVNKIGQEYKVRIYEDFLKISPPLQKTDGKLK